MLFYFCYKCIKKKIDSSLLWLSLTSLYFINIPLLYDSVLLPFHTNYEYYVIQANKQWVFGTIRHIQIISISSFVFNLLLYLSYFAIISPKKLFLINIINRKIKTINYNAIPWWLCFFICYISLIFFLINNGISSITHIGTGKWYANKIDNSVLNFISSFMLSLSSFTILKALVEKKIWAGMICIIPLIIIEYITGSRALIISVAFYFLYYIIINTKSMKLFNMLKIFISALSISALLTVWRGGLGFLYPSSKDVSYSDLFYAYSISEVISTHGSNTLRLLLTGFYK